MDSRELRSLLIRYAFLVLIALGNLAIIYKIFTPLTVYPSYWIIHSWYPDAVLLGSSTIFFKGYYAEIVSACIAGAAYYLLLILNLTTPLSLKKRVLSLMFLLGGFLILNIVRIAVFARLFEQGYNYFDITHILTWYIGSTLLVIMLWFSAVLIFKPKAIPVYTDMQALFKDVVQTRGET